MPSAASSASHSTMPVVLFLMQYAPTGTSGERIVVTLEYVVDVFVTMPTRPVSVITGS